MDLNRAFAGCPGFAMYGDIALPAWLPRFAVPNLARLGKQGRQAEEVQITLYVNNNFTRT